MGQSACRALVDDRPPVQEIPEKGRKARALRELQIGLCVVDRRFDLQSVAHDSGVRHQSRLVAISITRNALGIEVVEGGAEGGSFPEDGQPGQPRLEAFQDQLLEQPPVVGMRHAPFLVVVARIFGVGDATPRTAHELAVRFTLHVADALSAAACR
jgi:hypothetical protein